MGGLEKVIMDIENLKRKYGTIKRSRRDKIILNPLQTGSRLTEEARRSLIEFGDGYSVCDHCKGRLDKISNPPIHDFIYNDLPAFIGSDLVRLTHGAREGKFMIMHSMTKPGDTILVDGNRHYSTVIAAERAGLNIVEVETKGKEKKVDVEDYIPLIKQHQPKLILLTYPDGSLGNLADARRLGEIAKEYNLPYLINAAYGIGRMPINMKELGADFIVGSGHKSMSSAGPIGIVGMKEKWSERILIESSYSKGKEIQCLGCSVRGVPLITLMASFPYVVERVRSWDSEVEKARWFSREMEDMGMEQLGEKPHNHDLMAFNTPPLYEISQIHPKKRAFLYEALKKEEIFGLKHGATKYMKISTYMTPREDLQKVIDVIKNLILEYKS